ncbi:Nucleoside 2-deoxyribosyltransferase [Candidatus Burkholderia pumila]|uniref:Nucleoside 2-deoxyribosyltransferase n=1 Tax=Candidatus Burkholderia pumila TaxID=1090375 RepID=A0ABR5HL80_9BURK|nr:Nucleoside 2-deoxyribosyltransferase [Candidatus Burkholderia pumila]
MNAARVYLASPDVFRLDALGHGQYLKDLCTERGLVGLFPIDANAGVPDSAYQQATGIYENNLSLIRSCDVVMAGLDDFRGADEPDVGTAFEAGFATALGKPVFAYARDIRPLIERIPSHPAGRRAICEHGHVIEDFGLSMNLMLACSVTLVESGPVECRCRDSRSGSVPPQSAASMLCLRAKPAALYLRAQIGSSLEQVARRLLHRAGPLCLLQSAAAQCLHRRRPHSIHG